MTFAIAALAHPAVHQNYQLGEHSTLAGVPA